MTIGTTGMCCTEQPRVHQLNSLGAYAFVPTAWPNHKLVTPVRPITRDLTVGVRPAQCKQVMVEAGEGVKNSDIIVHINHKAWHYYVLLGQKKLCSRYFQICSHAHVQKVSTWLTVMGMAQ